MFCTNVYSAIIKCCPESKIYFDSNCLRNEFPQIEHYNSKHIFKKRNPIYVAVQTMLITYLFYYPFCSKLKMKKI